MRQNRPIRFLLYTTSPDATGWQMDFPYGQNPAFCVSLSLPASQMPEELFSKQHKASYWCEERDLREWRTQAAVCVREELQDTARVSQNIWKDGDEFTRRLYSQSETVVSFSKSSDVTTVSSCTKTRWQVCNSLQFTQNILFIFQNLVSIKKNCSVKKFGCFFTVRVKPGTRVPYAHLTNMLHLLWIENEGRHTVDIP